MAPSQSVELRRRLVQELTERGLIRSDAVRNAFLAVPRETFLPQFAARKGLEAVYRDDAIPTTFDPRGFPLSSSSQPAIMAEMLEQLRLEPGMRVLEIGAGTGYNAGLLAEIVGPRGTVTTIDVDPEIARGARRTLRSGRHRVRVVVGDGRQGFGERAPYDRIVVTASADTIPYAWYDQLAEGGLVEVPLRLTAAGTQVIPTLRRSGARLAWVTTICGGFMPLRAAGQDGTPLGRPPCLTAYDVTGDRPRPPLRQISGHALASFSAAAKRRLLTNALTDGRRRPLRIRAEAEALLLYLTLTLPRSRAIAVDSPPGWSVGVAARDGRSLAHVESSASDRTRPISFMTVYGNRRAADELAAAISAWDERGRPGPQQLRVSVQYRDGEPHVRRRWYLP